MLCGHHYSNWREKQRMCSIDHVMLGVVYCLSFPRGNLLSRSLIDIVKPEDFVQNSEYLQTVAVCVPRCVTMTPCCVMLQTVMLLAIGAFIGIGNENMKLSVT